MYAAIDFHRPFAPALFNTRIAKMFAPMNCRCNRLLPALMGGVANVEQDADSASRAEAARIGALATSEAQYSTAMGRLRVSGANTSRYTSAKTSWLYGNSKPS